MSYLNVVTLVLLTTSADRGDLGAALYRHHGLYYRLRYKTAELDLSFAPSVTGADLQAVRRFLLSTHYFTAVTIT